MKSVKLSFVGDIFPANMPYTKGFGNYSTIETFKLSNLAEKPDIFFANLEAPIKYNGDTNSVFLSNLKIVDLFKEIGINIVSISNNHILEHGAKGFYETIEILRKNNIKVIGFNENNSSNVEYFNIEKQKIAFASFNLIHDIENPSLYANLTKEGIEIALNKMNDGKATFKILSFHWGNEFINLPNPTQIELSKFAILKGCDLIIGHHPHVVQKIEVINNKYIFYSLGNAYFDDLFTKKVRIGLRVNATLNPNQVYYKYHYISTKSLNFVKIDKNIEDLLLIPGQKQRQNRGDYKIFFSKKIKRIRFINRVKMKLYILYQLLTLPFYNKIKLIQNLINRLLKNDKF